MPQPKLSDDSVTIKAETDQKVQLIQDATQAWGPLYAELLEVINCQTLLILQAQKLAAIV